jgi:hypothetical protein
LVEGGSAVAESGEVPCAPHEIRCENAGLVTAEEVSSLAVHAGIIKIRFFREYLLSKEGIDQIFTRLSSLVVMKLRAAATEWTAREQHFAVALGRERTECVEQSMFWDFL